MKCPLLIMASLHLRRDIANPNTDCLKEKCAWWSTEMNQCDPTGLIPFSKHLIERLDELIEKMPRS